MPKSNGNPQPPMTWRYAGNQIKRWRTRANVTREELAEEAHYGTETIKSMEQGRRKPTLRALQIADEMCGAHGLLLAAQDYLQPDGFPERTHEFMQAEAEAIALHSYEALFIPGLLQTEEYARALISASCPPLDDQAIEERVTARMQRQEKLTRQPTALFSFVIYEAALRSLVGGADVMKRQLQHLLEAGKLRNVSIQVLPVESAPHAALSGPLVLLETSEHEQYAYVEGQETSALHADPEKVSALAQRHGMIRAEALSTEESARFIEKIAEGL